MKTVLIASTISLIAGNFGFPSLLVAQPSPVDPIAEYTQHSQFWRANVLKKQNEPIDERPIPGTERMKTAQSPDLIEVFEEFEVEHAKPLKNLVMGDHASGLVFPGALYWSGPIYTESRLIPVPLPTNRANVRTVLTDVRIKEDCPTGGLEFNFPGNFGSYQTALLTRLDCVTGTAARVSFTYSDASHLKATLLDLNMSAKVWFNQLSGTLHEKREQNESTMAIALDQVYFTSVTDTPTQGGPFPLSLLNTSEYASQILPDMSSMGEVAFIRKVNYGRRLIITVSSSASQEDLEKSLKFKMGGFGVDIEGGVTDKVREVWRTMTVHGVLIGGKVNDGFARTLMADPQNILQNLSAFIGETITFDSETVAVPISFEVALARGHMPLALYETTQFSKRNFVGNYCRSPVTVENQIIQMNESIEGTTMELTAGDRDIHSDDWTGVRVKYSIHPSANKKMVQLKLMMEAIELERNKNFNTRPGDRTKIETTNIFTVYTIPESCPNSRIVSIKNIINNGNKLNRDYYGPFHNPRGFPKLGQLTRMSVIVDSDKDNDMPVQSFSGTLSGFRVTLNDPTQVD